MCEPEDSVDLVILEVPEFDDSFLTPAYYLSKTMRDPCFSVNGFMT